MDKHGKPITRRHVLGVAVAGVGVAGVAAVVAGCSGGTSASPPATTRPRPPAPTTTATTTTVAPGGPAVQFARAGSGRPEVALTFHGAGDIGIARHIHDTLASAGAKATIMAVGTWVAASPDGIRMFHDAGHDIGNHTWSHGVMADMPAPTVLSEIERCRDALHTVLGTPGAFFRQSSAQTATAQELTEAGIAGYTRVLSYDVDGLDWKDPGPTVIRKAVATATAGGIVSLHLGHQGTVIALPGILTDLAARGLTPVTATELLG
ncbi:MAG TPA: polysaccharide deacetylase family protein [Pseudonocardiaceae bacterium]|nr:polysaccharide deacetylase family protein [Pseudonocardiaceae bacterium]